MATTHKRILVLVSSRPKNPRGFNWHGLQEELAQLLEQRAQIEICALTDLVYEAGKNSRIYHQNDGYDIADFDLVLFRTVGAMLEYGIAAAHYLQSKGVRFTDTYLLTQGRGKLACSFERAANNLPVPLTLYAPAAILEKVIKKSESITPPFILKADTGKKGRDNYLITSTQQLKTAIKDCAAREVDMIAQEYIVSTGDYRILVLNYKPRLALFRRSQTDTHLTNTSQGGTAEIVDLGTLNETILVDAVAAARLEKLEVAGVDIIIDEATGNHYILEVNRAPQIPTGAYASEKMKAYASFMTELLDAPSEYNQPAKDILGRAEFISLPDLGFSEVPAKIDTGADRSAIWCSVAREVDGRLHCIFFGKGSSWYSGEVIVFEHDSYRLTRVANSFGDKELRYKVKLRVKIAERTINATFTLADRSQKLYPVLIGRGTLRNKFLVDVDRGDPLRNEERNRARMLREELNSMKSE